MPRIAPVPMILGLMVGALFTLTVVLVKLINSFEDESPGRARAAVVPIAANAGRAPPQEG